MKKIKIITYSIFALSLLSSCDKEFLTLYPEGNLNEGNFFLSTEDFETALVGAYVPLRDVASIAYFMDEIRADNSTYIYNARDRGNASIENIETYLNQADNATTYARYQADYNGISRTNIILDNMEDIAFEMSDEDKNRIIGEAKALRAFYYFDLARNYGGVPLHLNQVTTIEETALPRATLDELYAQILSDLTDAIPLLPDPIFSGSQTGRMNKGSASTALAHVYLRLEEYDNAIPLLRDVTQMDYELLPDFRDIFNPANKGNQEIIFAVQYQSGNTGQESNFIYRFTPITTDTQEILGVSFNNTIGGWNVPAENLINLFEPGDQRFDASIGVIEGTDDDQGYIPSGVESAVGYTPTPGVDYHYFTKKYYYPPYPNLNQNTDQNWPVYRYSEVLLMLAESLNETGASAEALTYLNQVRTRAFGSGNGQITETDQTNLRGIIAEERRLELVFENKRYQDLIRTDRAIPVMTEFGEEQKEKFPFLLPQAYNIEKYKLLYPIPQRELELNPLLVQNPGY
ncbi:RagB/SusD family nutrient uptake outer membrane protein [Autumnicola edwardsiae]|uniref:RagB/SusD family nutrient uptake outer membrane protein n=1 Tax=Autumnicola edwardsiae TaxID=3075594 RepID=A0ABU3CXL4_9FLAO|nr:RagB/SusD family nutrient uptake outer membrane protein [Zunongwangia sp. F297]MDT0651061.1 RagB/SusD family nutrient uptake outer membrane protein [Zunongwangia sp. F297]